MMYFQVEQEVSRIASESPNPVLWVHRTVPERDLPILYSGAAVFVPPACSSLQGRKKGESIDLNIFMIEDEHIELIKLLKAAGLCESGGAAKVAVERGLVTVDGREESRKRRKIRDGQEITFAGESITVKRIPPR